VTTISYTYTLNYTAAFHETAMIKVSSQESMIRLDKSVNCSLKKVACLIFTPFIVEKV
jgi:hypothetical protein